VNKLTTTLAKQATRTVVSKTIRNTAKTVVPTNSLWYKVGVSALIAAAGHLITKGIPSPKPSTLLEDGFDEPPSDILLTEQELEDLMNQRMLAKKAKQ